MVTFDSSQTALPCRCLEVAASACASKYKFKLPF